MQLPKQNSPLGSMHQGYQFAHFVQKLLQMDGSIVIAIETPLY